MLFFLFSGLNPSNARTLLSKYGEIDRIYFEPEKFRRGIPYAYKEGWVEYKKKRVAKMVANTLNGQAISAKKKSPFAEAIWTMKYLHRFKWHHLNEQVTFDQRSKEQRLRMELGKVRKEADFYTGQLMKLKKLKKNPEQKLDDEKLNSRKAFYQKKQLHPAKPKETNFDSSLLERIFVG